MNRWARSLRALSIGATLYAAAVAGLSGLNLIAPQSNGPLALSQILAPHLLLPVVAFVPLAAAHRDTALRLSVGFALLLGLVRFGPGLLSMPPNGVPEGSPTVGFLSWNLEVGSPDGAQVAVVLANTSAEVVAFQELTPALAATIEANPVLKRQFPFRAIYPVTGVAGMGILSRYPITSVDHALDPALVEVILELPGGTRLTVVDAHPFPAAIDTVTSFRLPIGFDATRRDADIDRLRRRIDPVLDSGAPIVLLGDFNLTDREPAHAILTSRLRDTHLEVGQGSGSTWRPDRFKFLPIGLLRIDYLLAGPGLRPIAISEDCTPRGSDHCIVSGRLALVYGSGD